MADRDFVQKIVRIRSQGVSYHTFSYTTEECIEELEKIIFDQREALERIAYPTRYPEWEPQQNAAERDNQLRQWMASTAANALTNAGTGHFSDTGDRQR